MSKKKIAYCGDVCSFCPRYVATQSGSEEELKKVAILLEKIGWRSETLPPKKVECLGCQDIEVCEYDVKECCIAQNIPNCGKCPKYPCPKIERAFEISATNMARFRMILTEREFATFMRAFFWKKANLDAEKNTINE
ncbi:MAG: DUF3795 domain-containing protein [Promethearchaeota archaeon]